MIIAFFGHKNFCEGKRLEQPLLSILEEKISGEDVEFFLGGYGRFDTFALSVARRYQKTFPKAKTVFITPYLQENYQKLYWAKLEYDAIIYPPIEGTPYRFAIAKRNAWMVEQADLCIFYVRQTYGGAYQALCHAERCGKAYVKL